MFIDNNKIEICFTNNTSANKAKEIFIDSLTSFNGKVTYENGVKDTISRIVVENNTVKHPEHGAADLTSDDLINVVMPTALKAIAEKLPSDNFTFDIYGDDQYSEGWIEGKYENGVLEMNSTYYPMGFEDILECPECGEMVVSMDEYDPSKQYVCPECGEAIDLSEQYEETRPIIENIIIKLA